MKKFTLEQIKEFCRAHYGEYLQERNLVIRVDFISEDYVKKISFSNLAISECYFSGLWRYAGCDTVDSNIHIFKFKRIA